MGKTTLIKSLIKRYTKQNLSTPTGPLTVVTSKRRRLTFIESPADSLASMIDVSKIADIVLLMIDGNFGFEMDTLEFLNILASSGMPGNIFGILTHLDLFRKPSTLRDAKKRLKRRFWSELYQGAKLFYLSGVMNGRYPDREIHNISRFISVMKNPRPLVWRNSHPYCLADRFLDITPPTAIEADSKCDRTVALYGYIRGTNFPAEGARVHIPGVGDLNVSMIEALPDPCPTPYMDQAVAKATGKSGRRRLGEKQKLLFAPMSDVGGVLVDKDAVYIDVKTSTFDKDAGSAEERGLGEQMVIGLQAERRLLGEAEDGVRLFEGGTALKESNESTLDDVGRKEKRKPRPVDGGEVYDDNDEVDIQEDGFASSEDNETDDGTFEEHNFAGNGPEQSLKVTRDDSPHAHGDGDVAFADSDSDIGTVSSVENQEFDSGLEESDEDEEDAALRWKSNLKENAKISHGIRQNYRASDFAKLLYDESISPAEVVRRWRGEPTSAVQESLNDDGPEEDQDFFIKKAKQQDSHDDLDDRSIPNYDYAALEEKWSNVENLEELRQRFASAKLSKAAPASSGNGGDGLEETSNEGQDDEGDGEFQDLEKDPSGVETSQDDLLVSLEEERDRNARKKEELKLRFEEEDREGFGNDKRDERRQGNGNPEEQFGEDDWYEAQKAQIQKQLNINRTEFESLDEASRVRVEGYKAGTYARIVIDQVPYEFVSSFNPRFPVIIGGLAPTEDRFGFVQVRIKRHRWHKKILKTNDPLIFSLGWRRFQTLPLYSISDSRTRNRMLKYTPEHMHCFGTFYGPLIAPNTGFCCFQSLANENPGCRVAATGVVLNVDENTEIVKKLKLTGYPYKIFRNTAFIKDMFSTSLEIAKFEGASIRTVSGIRGQIKRALSKPEGCFRATFEDKILMSDIVFLRAWYPVKPQRFYNPVTNLLGPADAGSKGDGWKSMRLTGTVRRDEGLPTPMQKDSAYRPIERPTRHFNPLRVPRQLAADLPFRSRIVQMRPRKQPTYLQKRAVVLDGEEKRARDLMNKIMSLRKEKLEKRRASKEEKRQVHRQKVAENEEKKREREKRERDEFWRKEGKKRKREGGDGERGKRKRA